MNLPPTEQPEPRDPQSQAESLYARHLAGRGRGGAEGFDELCARHPELAAALRELDARQRKYGDILGGASNDGGGGFFRREERKQDPRAGGLARHFDPGEQIGDFKLVRFLGHGGMGQVWEATQLSMRRAVALKFVLPKYTDEAILARIASLFEREAHAGGRARHPNLVTTYGHGEDMGVKWIAQELVPGSFTLARAIEDLRQDGNLPAGYYQHASTLLLGVARGMEAAHAAGVVHRDIKPQNILIDEQDTPKVADFGLARVADDSLLSKSGEAAGTYQYMSPEQLVAKRGSVDHRTDIFSLGVVMYELLTLQRPFEGDTHALAQKILFVDPPDAHTIRTQCPRDLSVICAKALEKDPAKRYPTMAEFAADIERHLKNEEILAKPATRVEKARKWVLRHPAASVGIAIGSTALVVISGLGLYALGQASEAKVQAQRAEKGEADAKQQASRAEAGEQAAKDNLVLANKNADEARRNAEMATQKANDVLSLSAQKEHEDLVALADQLWPADSTMVSRYEDWLRKTRLLLDGQPADEARGLKKRPSLAEHQAKLTELRREALPLSEEQIRADRESHPQFAELQAKQAELLWRSRMLGLEPWPTAAAVEAELAKESLPADADGLNALAWKLVDPKQPIFGEEVRALLLAKRALDGVAEDKRAPIRDTYAWALYRNGRLEEALKEIETAVSEPGGDELKASKKDLEKAVEQWQGGELAKRRERRATLAKEVDALTAQVNTRRTFEYADAEKSWWDRQLRVLVANLEQLQDEKTGLAGAGTSIEHGWGVQKRFEMAKTLRELTIDGAESRRRWEEAILAIAKSEKYRDTVFPGGGLLTPQEGLLPLGADPQSGLWEFLHVLSGLEPERDKDGNFRRQKSGAHKLAEKPERGTGIVLVLIPGGKFWMGAQNKPGAQNHDPTARSDEGPVHEVELSPYFLSKYEMTQGQWQRFTGLNPSYYKSGGNGTVGPTNPVEQVSWLDCERVLRQLGLELPSEAQWEHGARGGTSTRWWTGQEFESLRGKVNVAEKSYVAAGGNAAETADMPDLDDGSVVHAAVGKYDANGFGLHEVAGNIGEWCLDGYDGEFYREQTGKDPVSPLSGSVARVLRGGYWSISPAYARSARRFDYTPVNRDNVSGLRPSRRITP